MLNMTTLERNTVTLSGIEGVSVDIVINLTNLQQILDRNDEIYQEIVREVAERGLEGLGKEEIKDLTIRLINLGYAIRSLSRAGANEGHI